MGLFCSTFPLMLSLPLAPHAHRPNKYASGSESDLIATFQVFHFIQSIEPFCWARFQAFPRSGTFQVGSSQLSIFAGMFFLRNLYLRTTIYHAWSQFVSFFSYLHFKDTYHAAIRLYTIDNFTKISGLRKEHKWAPHDICIMCIYIDLNNKIV